ncbi:helix-turn-helix transcriptional regulator [Caproiciproducens sp. LBM24188]|nr:WYL domain-containing protein [Oscillospiraceae bacterium]HHV31730.1 WYL domain-containing protein [Clostridiales bacterium]
MEYTGNTKMKLLVLMKLLTEYSDEEHPMNSSELCSLLEQAGIHSERKSLYRDIAILSEAGIDIVRTKSPRPGFFIAKREFELPEVRLLMDAVLTAPFITNKKTTELTEKLKSLLSRHQAESISNQIFIEKRVKFDNEEIYYTIDAINRAIANNKQITFQYRHRVIKDHKLGFDSGREFTISPYALIWANDKYYLAGNYAKYDDVSNYRVDRMRHVVVTEQEARPFSEVSPYREYFDSADYLKKSFNMYHGEQEMVELRCTNDILETVADKFGDEVEFCCHDEKGFTVRARVYVSKGLVEWLLQYGDRIVVQQPKHLREEMIHQIEALRGAYGISQKTCAL